MELAIILGWDYLKMAWDSRSFPRVSLRWLGGFFLLCLMDLADGN